MVQLGFAQTSRMPAVTGKCPCPAITLITRPRDWADTSSSQSSTSSLSSDQGKCYGLNCVPPKDAEVLTPTTSECDFIWKQSLVVFKLVGSHQSGPWSDTTMSSWKGEMHERVNSVPGLAVYCFSPRGYQKLRRKPRTGLSLAPLEGAWPSLHLDLKHLASGTVRQ